MKAWSLWYRLMAFTIFRLGTYKFSAHSWLLSSLSNLTWNVLFPHPYILFTPTTLTLSRISFACFLGTLLRPIPPQLDNSYPSFRFQIKCQLPQRNFLWFPRVGQAFFFFSVSALISLGFLPLQYISFHNYVVVWRNWNKYHPASEVAMRHSEEN